MGQVINNYDSLSLFDTSFRFAEAEKVNWMRYDTIYYLATRVNTVKEFNELELCVSVRFGLF